MNSYRYHNYTLVVIPNVRVNGVFTTFRSDCRKLEAHYERLLTHSRQFLNTPCRLHFDELIWLQQALAAQPQVVKVIVSEAGCFVQTRALPSEQEVIHLVSKQAAPRTAEARLKLTQRMEYVAQLQASQRAGYTDTLYYDQAGIVLETTIANCFWSDGVRLYTPSATLPILAGTYRQFVQQWCQTAGIVCVEGAFTLERCKREAKMVWICNAIRGWQVVMKIDDDWQAAPTAWCQELTQKIQQQEW